MSTVFVRGLVLTDHEIEVPLDHARPGGETLTVYAREVARPDGRDKPFLVYLQGGPGHEAPRPVGFPSSPGWLERALQDYRVLMLDQRGTGRSTPFGGADTRSPQKQADYLTHFRADAIVADAEALRRHLGVERWSLLGQSFGGFTTLAYLSSAPGSVAEAFFTGGLPPIGRPVDDIYAATYRAMRAKSKAYYRRFPDDRARMRRLLDACADGEVILPGGDVCSPQRLRTIGYKLGADGGAEEVHYLLERDHRSPAFGYDLAAAMPFDGRNPMYAVIHESSYADGHATRWSAQRVTPEDFRADLTLFTGEHIFEWYFEECSDLAPFAETAAILAEHEWPALYDADVLSSIDVPCAAAVYADDAFVDRAFSEQTAALIPTMRPWLTNEYEHSGLRADGARVLDRLIRLARGHL